MAPSWKKCVKSLFSFLDPPPSWKIYAMSLFTFLDPPPSWKKCVMSLFPIYSRRQGSLGNRTSSRSSMFLIFIFKVQLFKFSVFAVTSRRTDLKLWNASGPWCWYFYANCSTITVQILPLAWWSVLPYVDKKNAPAVTVWQVPFIP